MTTFRWRPMDERPREGKGHFVLRGRRGGVYYANEYRTYETCGAFHVPNLRCPWKTTGEVEAWAEIPMEEVGA